MSQLTLLTPIQPEAPTEINSNRSSPVTQPLRQKALEFSSLIGQSIAYYLLSGAIETHRVAPAYLFAGVDGIGKTLAAKIFSAQVLGTGSINNHPDLSLRASTRRRFVLSRLENSPNFSVALP